MLYHWYELDVESEALSVGGEQEPALISQPALHYSPSDAIAHAHGAPHRLNASNLTLKAANDRHTDAIAIRLRKAGLGVIGERRQRAQPGDYNAMHNAVLGAVQLCRSTFKLLPRCLQDAIELVTQRHRHNVSSWSHTMVSNGADDRATTGDDAQRQRSSASMG